MPKPSMRAWTDAWHDADAVAFKNVYAEQALIFPPQKPALQGRDSIFAFLKGGLGKVDVVFEPESSIVEEELAFEQGVFRDMERPSRKVSGEGKYSVTWTLEKGVWKILCHAWSMPVKL